MNPWQGLTGTAPNIAQQPYTQPKKPRRHTPRPVYDNPWSLTPAECRAITALVKCGSNVETAERLGIALKTLEAQIDALRKKMDVPNRIRAAVEWDRYQQATQGATV